MSITLSGLRTSASFAENTVNASPQLLDPDGVSLAATGVPPLFTPIVTLSNASVTVSGLLAEDRVSLGAFGGITLSGSQVLLNGTLIGTASGGAGSNFTVAFIGVQTLATVELVIEALNYANMSNTPAASRTLGVSVNAAGIAAPGTAQMTVGVTPENDAPSITSADFVNVVENLAAGTAFYTARATDPDGNPITWSLAGTDAALFQISAAGAVSFRGSPDFERPRDANGENKYDIIVRANDGTATAERPVVVGVTNVVDSPFIAGIGPLTITETEAEAGVFIAPNAELRYGDASFLFLDFFIGESDPGLRLQFRNTADVTVLAFQSSFFRLQLTGGPLFEGRVSDGLLPIESTDFAALTPAQRDAVLRSLVATSTSDNPALDRTIRFTGQDLIPLGSLDLRISPVNDAPVVTTMPALVREGSTALFALASAGDAETAVSALAFTLSGADAGLFDVVTSNGQLSLAFRNAPDFEAPADANGDNRYEVTVSVSDGQLSTARSATVTVTDALETALTLLDTHRVLTAAQTASGLQQLDADVVFNSADDALAGGALTVSGLKPNDVVGLIHTGDGPGQIGVTGSQVRFGGQVIGTASGGVGEPFRVELDGPAVTPVAVERLIEALGFRTATATPDASRRLLIEFIDADGRRIDPDPGADFERLLPRAGGAGEPTSVTPYALVQALPLPVQLHLRTADGLTLLDLTGDGRAELLGYTDTTTQLRAFRAATDIWSEQPSLAPNSRPSPPATAGRSTSWTSTWTAGSTSSSPSRPGPCSPSATPRRGSRNWGRPTAPSPPSPPPRPAASPSATWTRTGEAT